MRTKSIISLIALSFYLCATVQAQTAEQTSNAEEQIRIHTPWGHYDDFIADGAANGLILSLPDGFTAWTSNGSASGANYMCILHSEDGEAKVIVQPIKTPANTKIWEIEGEKVIAGTELSGRLIDPAEQDPQVIEQVYDMMRNGTHIRKADRTQELDAPHKEMPQRVVKRLFNAERGYVVKSSYLSQDTQEELHGVTYTLKRGDVLFTFSLQMTDKGKKNEEQYLKALHDAVEFK
jgi:hypothetical protein